MKAGWAWSTYALVAYAPNQLFRQPLAASSRVLLLSAPTPNADSRQLGSPQWSLDGNLLYYLCARDGSSGVWTQRLHPATRKPVGDAFAVFHFTACPL